MTSPQQMNLPGEDAVLLCRQIFGDCAFSRSVSRSSTLRHSHLIRTELVGWVSEAVLTGMTSLAIMELTKERQMINLSHVKVLSLVNRVEATVLRNDKVRKGCFNSRIGRDFRIEEAVEPWVHGWVDADGVQEMVKDEKGRELCRIALLELAEGHTPLVDECLRPIASVCGVHKPEEIGEAGFVRAGCKGAVEVGVCSACIIGVENVKLDRLMDGGVE